MLNYRDPFAWRGPRDRGDTSRDLSLLQLIEARSLDIPLAALLWLSVEQKASIIVAAQPRLAGKTTVLTALRDLIPPTFDIVYTRGEQEDFAFLNVMDPGGTYILCNEISDHLPAYLWGPKVRILFEALARGYSLGATIHAESPEEVMETLEGPPLLVSKRWTAHVTFILNLLAEERPNGILRRVELLTLLARSGPASSPYALLPISWWDEESETFVRDTSPVALQALEHRLGLPGTLREELARREEFLTKWKVQGLRTAAELKRHVLDHYQSRSL